MKPILTVCFLVCGLAAAADTVAPSAPIWEPVVDLKDPLTIGDKIYFPESAKHNWNIQRATNFSSDLFRFEVRSGDKWAEDVDSGENKERAELDGYKASWGNEVPVWGAYSFFIEPGAAFHSDWTAIGQMHGDKVRPFHIHFTKDVFTIYSERLGTSGAASIAHYSGRVLRNIWHNVVFHLIQSTSNSGRLEFWLDSKKVVDFTGPIGAEENEAFWKFGIYRGYGPIATSFAIQYANMEVSMNDLTSRVAKPLPIK